MHNRQEQRRDVAYWAHTQQEEGAKLRIHELSEHLREVAQLAAQFAEGFGKPWGHLAGIWHDLGKYRPGFQAYIRQTSNAPISEAHIEGRVQSSDKTHSAAGALHALLLFESRWGPQGRQFAKLLAYVIAGHHAGLANWTADLDDRLLGGRGSISRTEYDEAHKSCQHAAPSILQLPDEFDLVQALRSAKGLATDDMLARSLWVRLLFSALVDADFLDTERFLNSARYDARHRFAAPQKLLSQLDAHLDALAAAADASGRGQDLVMQARRDVLRQCRAKASLPPGVFTLTVPTGGGKTLSSLAFALRHVVTHDLQRVVYAIPYTSIIEQTADVFSAIFGSENIVEHHSQADVADNHETAASRLACENWDAPLVVTTTVQLFESLFASRTSRCRKLHRLRNSVIVLDEAQLLPPTFLQPILDVLKALVQHHGVTVVLCTATQPALTSQTAFDPSRRLRGLPPPTPIVDDEQTLFAVLERVRIRWPEDLHTATQWPPLAADIAQQDCALAIVNTRQDAHELTRALPHGTLHLSAAMCGAHRKEVIEDIRARLRARSAGDQTPLRVVSTQLIEAGVDVDFPIVYRSLAGLDSIAQSAGRCNREGRLHRGELVVFVRDVPRTLSQVRAGVEATRSMKAQGLGENIGPDDFTRYFRQFYRSQKLDAHDIVAELEDLDCTLSFNFRSAAEKFKLVDDGDQASLIVPYHECSSDSERHSALPALLAQLEAGALDRWMLRSLQRYTVSVRQRDVLDMQAKGDVKELQPGLYLLKDMLRYHPLFGLLPRGNPIDVASLVQ